MKTKSVYKVPNGKLIKIFLEYDPPSHVISSIQIAGDFFAYPEESIHQLEQRLIGSRLEKKELQNQISSFLEEHHVQFIGICPKSLTEAVMRCPL